MSDYPTFDAVVLRAWSMVDAFVQCDVPTELILDELEELKGDLEDRISAIEEEEDAGDSPD